MSDPFDPFDFDSESLEEEDASSQEDWIEISNINGETASLRHLATVKIDEQFYYVLGAVREFEGRTEKALVVIREDQTMDGALQHVIASNESELEQVISHLFNHALSNQLSDERSVFSDDSVESSCGCRHMAGEFCYCGNPAYLQ